MAYHPTRPGRNSNKNCRDSIESRPLSDSKQPPDLERLATLAVSVRQWVRQGGELPPEALDLLAGLRMPWGDSRHKSHARSQIPARLAWVQWCLRAWDHEEDSSYLEGLLGQSPYRHHKRFRRLDQLKAVRSLDQHLRRLWLLHYREAPQDESRLAILRSMSAALVAERRLKSGVLFPSWSRLLWDILGCPEQFLARLLEDPPKAIPRPSMIPSNETT